MVRRPSAHDFSSQTAQLRATSAQAATADVVCCTQNPKPDVGTRTAETGRDGEEQQAGLGGVSMMEARVLARAARRARTSEHTPKPRAHGGLAVGRHAELDHLRVEGLEPSSVAGRSRSSKRRVKVALKLARELGGGAACGRHTGDGRGGKDGEEPAGTVE